MLPYPKQTGIAESTIRIGKREMKAAAKSGYKTGPNHGIRRKGGGRKPLTKIDNELLGKLDALVEPTSRGGPHVPFEMDMQKHPKACKRANVSGASRESFQGWAITFGAELQSPKHPETDGRQIACGS